MIDYEVFERLMATFPIESGFALSPMGPDDAEATEARWWADQGIDYAAVKKWCLEQSVEDYNGIMRGTLAPGYPQRVTVPASLAAAYNMGLIMGLRLARETP